MEKEMNLAEKRLEQSGIRSLGDMKRRGLVSGKIDPKKAIKGPKDIDCLVRPWQRGDMTGILAGTGVGKCHAKGSEILMYDGSIKKVEDIKVGDQLMGPDSTPRNVLSLARGKEEMFKISGTDGTSYTVNRSHILSLRYSANEKRFGCEKGDIVNISVHDYLEKSDKFKHLFKGYRTGVEFDYKETNFDPYLMGLFLGDGTKADGGISTIDNEIITYLKEYMGDKLGYKVSNANKNIEGKCPTFRMTTEKGQPNYYRQETRKFVNENNERIIDKNYLINSREVRLGLLAGIIDSDGSLSNNCYDITMKDETFAKNFEYLCRSLGFKVNRSVKTIEYKGEERSYFRFTISGDIVEVPVKLPRKMGAERKQIKDPLNYGITVESVGEGDYYGFTLDGDHLFLLGDFVVTHNTTFVLKVLKEILQNNPDGVVAFVSLELVAAEIAEKWFKATEDCPELADRLYIVENFDDEGNCLDLTLSDIHIELKKIKDVLGTTLHAYALDHLHEININGTMDYNPTCREIKNMTVALDSHGFILSQTTKGKGVGDIPVPKDGCFRNF